MKPFIFLAFVLSVLSCGNSANFEGGDPNDHFAKVAAAPEYEAESKAAPPSADRKLIKTGFLEIEVGDVAQTRLDIEKICQEFEAYVSSETQTNYKERLAFEQVIRIPAAHFDVFLNRAEALAVEVESRNIQTSDVTEEFIDKEARIKTKKELESRYREILQQAKAVSDILSIEAQLNHVRADIESMEGRLNYLRNQVAFSTLTLTFYETIGADYGFGSKTVAAFSNGWEMLLLFIIGLLNVWPFILLAAILVFFLIRKRMSLSKPRVD